MAHHYHRRQMRQIAEAQAKAGESGSSSGANASGTSSDDQPVTNHPTLNDSVPCEDWNPNQIVYRKVRTKFYNEKKKKKNENQKSKIEKFSITIFNFCLPSPTFDRC